MNHAVNDLKKGLYEQKVLHELEALCVQEELPFCEASCPLHVEVKEILSLVGIGKFKEAYQLFAKRISFPKIIGATCDAPCEKKCKRDSIGGSIKINKIEEFLVGVSYVPPKKPLVLPKNVLSVGIVGSGLRGLAAAYDLLKKGYQVTLYEKGQRLGGSLWDYTELTESVIEESIAPLFDYPLSVVYEKEVPCNSLAEAGLFLKSTTHDALYIAANTPCSGESDPKTYVTKHSQIITGKSGDSTIDALFDGKKAAISMDRVLKKVSVTAGREKEGSFESRLYTNISDYEVVAPVPIDFMEEVSAIEEGQRCIQCECLECVKGCSFMQHYKSYPRKMVREVYNNLSIAIGRHHANQMINSCNACQQCGSICPNGLDMTEIFLAARNLMVNTGKMPASAFEFALLDLEYSNGDNCFFVSHQKGWEVSSHIFFPSCQLIASEPKLVERIYHDLGEQLDGGVGVILGCCGIMAYWAGDEALFKASLEKLTEAWESLGRGTLVTACPTCLKTLREHTSIEAIGLWELEGRSVEGSLGLELMIHDACSARYDEGTQREIRNLAGNLGVKVLEPTFTKEVSPCCGYGGLMPFSNRGLADKIIKDRVEGVGEGFLTYCINCRDRMLKEGKDAYYIFELPYAGEDILKRHYPTWSERQDNRYLVKNDLMKLLWGEEMEKKKRVKLYIEEGLQELLEERMILESNLSEGILLGEENESKICDPETGFFTTCYQPGNVTFWIVYQPYEDGYYIKNAYSHRMTFKSR